MTNEEIEKLFTRINMLLKVKGVRLYFHDSKRDLHLEIMYPEKDDISIQACYIHDSEILETIYLEDYENISLLDFTNKITVVREIEIPFWDYHWDSIDLFRKDLSKRS